MRYADIVLPLAQPLYTFAVAEGVTLCEGMAVAVPFGRSKIYTGIVWRLHDRRPDFKTVKTVSRALYGTPLLDERQRRFWEWVADYYMCSLGEVMRVALPSLMKPSGHGEEEFAADEFRPRREWFVALAGEALTADGLAAALERMGRRAPRQREALEELAALAPDGAEVARSRLAADRTALALLVKKGLLTCIEREVAPGPVTGGAQFRLPTLSAAQRKAAEEIRAVFADRATVLLRGVTGSGKTEIYMHFAAEVLARGGQVLLLVPEIALTAQLVDRLRQVFGERVIAYHSKLTDRKRTELYLRLRDSAGGELVIGARSAIFLPLRRLELVVVDEEHDPSYKQTDPAPRYQARDCAVLMTRLLGCRTLLGSATPSLESYLNAATGKYGSVVLAERYGPSRMPQILVSDTIRAVKRGERHAHFNKLLLDRMEETLGGGGQAMLFQNRRGFAPYVECRECGWTARCPDCNVTLTLHKGSGRMVCHYCGHTEPVPAKCPHCRVTEPVPMGFGTEKVEEEIARVFPEARVARLDRDSVTSERAFRQIVEAFARGDDDILVGTQMITKGFDFGGVELVGVLNADNLLNNPDFRSAERAFQLLMQVAGRAGRRENPGTVVIQTVEPGHPVLQQVIAGDYEAMARQQLAERKAFFYPPYARLLNLLLRHRDPVTLRRAANALAAALRERFGRRVLGPTAPPVDRVRGEYLATLLLKIEAGASLARAREAVRGILDRVVKSPECKGVTILCDVDPQ